MLDFFNSQAFETFGAATSWAEVFGFISGLLCVYYVTRQNVWNFPLGIINAFFFCILFWDAKLYADSTLQIVYIGLNSVGWFAWLRWGPGRSKLPVSRASHWELFYLGCFLLAFWCLSSWYLGEHDSSAPHLDALTTGLSLCAQYLLIRKRVQNWYFWIVADLIYIPLYFSRDLYLTGIVYCCFLALCVYGLRSWRKEINV